MLKQGFQNAIRSAHLLFAGGLPERLGVYLHDLRREHWGSFREMVTHVLGQGYRFVDAEGLCRAEGRAVYLSFDDNHRSWFEALDLLDQLGVRATFYVNSAPLRDGAGPEVLESYLLRIGHRGEYRPLSRAELRALRDAGHSIGGHTHGHARLTAVPRAEAEREIGLNKEILEDVLGAPVTDFAYPYGMRRFFTGELEGYCLSLGFRTIAAATPGLQRRGHTPREIQRTAWNPEKPFRYNLDNLRIDGRLFERLTGRSATPS